MDDILEACKKAIQREGSSYFNKQPKKLVSVHYVPGKVTLGCNVCVTFHPIESLHVLDVQYLYSIHRGLQLFNQIGALQGLSVIEVPRNLMVPEIKPETLVQLINWGFVPFNELEFDPALCHNHKTLVEVINKDWSQYGDSLLFYVKKLGVDLDSLNNLFNEMKDRDLI